MNFRTCASAMAGCLAFALGACRPPDKNRADQTIDPSPSTPLSQDACHTDRAADCHAIEERISDLTARRDAAHEQSDAANLWRISLSLNREMETLRLISLGQDSPEAMQALASKYEALASTLEADLKDRLLPEAATDVVGEEGRNEPNEPTRAPPSIASPVGGDHGGEAGDNGADRPPASHAPAVSTTPPPGYVYHPSETLVVAAVMKEFGDLWIGESVHHAGDAESWEELSVAMPWTSFWYPIRGNEIFEGADAPLAKLDRALSNAGRRGRAVEEEQRHRGESQADTWEGLCSYWALASILTPEPSADVTVHDVTFTPNDQKALLIKIHERVPTRYYGVRYQGNADTDGTIEDLRPEAFHRLAIHRLGVERKPFIVDEDPGIEVWSKPVYRLRWNVKKDPLRDDAFVVRAFPWMVRERKTLDATPTSVADRAAPAYEYRLYVDRTVENDGKFKVIAGEWIGRSRDAHPDAIVLPVVAHEKSSNNPGINEAMDVVRQVVGLR